MVQICAAGELLIDFTPCGTAPSGQALYARNPGGAPANMLAMAAKLGASVYLCSKVGNDNFGNFLIKSAIDAGIDESHIHRIEDVRTTLAIVDLDENHDRSFTFYRKPGADIMLEDSDIPDELLNECDIYHFSGVSLTDEPAHGAVIRAAARAKARGCLVSFDPNYRPFLWPDSEEARKAFFEAISFSDIVKLSDDELALLTNKTTLEEGGKEILKLGPSLLLISCGAKGSYGLTANGVFEHSPALPVEVIDTTGAGDAFLGAALVKLAQKSKKDLAGLAAENLKEILYFCNIAGSLTTTKLGAIPALPNKKEIEFILNLEEK